MDSDSDYDDIESGLSMDDDSDDSDFDDIESDDSDDSDLDDIVKNNNLHWWKTEETPLLRYAILVLILVPMLALSYNWFYFRVDPDCSFCTLHADLIVSLFLCFRFILYSTILRDVTRPAVWEQMVISTMTLLYLFDTKSSWEPYQPCRCPQASITFPMIWLAVLILKSFKHRSYTSTR